MGLYYLVGEGSVKTKLIGKIHVDQMRLENDGRWILPRISPICENCNNNKHYNVYKSYNTYIFGLPFKLDVIYKIVCPECNETIELEIEEFLTIEPFIKINSKLDEGKISEKEHRYKVDTIMYKLNKKLK